MIEIQRSNPQAFKNLIKKAEAIATEQAKVGFFPGAVYPDGTPVAYVASIQEYGSASQNIPPRSFMRSTVMEKQDEWRDKIAKTTVRELEGKLPQGSTMETLALTVQGDISKKISEIQAPPLSPITLGARKYRQEGKKVTGATIGEIAAKLKAGTLDLSGVSTKPLEDTGLMSSSLTSLVEKA